MSTLHLGRVAHRPDPIQLALARENKYPTTASTSYNGATSAFQKEIYVPHSAYIQQYGNRSPGQHSPNLVVPEGGNNLYISPVGSNSQLATPRRSYEATGAVTPRTPPRALHTPRTPSRKQYLLTFPSSTASSSPNSQLLFTPIFSPEIEAANRNNTPIPGQTSTPPTSPTPTPQSQLPPSYVLSPPATPSWKRLFSKPEDVQEFSILREKSVVHKRGDRPVKKRTKTPLFRLRPAPSASSRRSRRSSAPPVLAASLDIAPAYSSQEPTSPAPVALSEETPDLNTIPHLEALLQNQREDLDDEQFEGEVRRRSNRISKWLRRSSVVPVPITPVSAPANMMSFAPPPENASRRGGKKAKKGKKAVRRETMPAPTQRSSGEKRKVRTWTIDGVVFVWCQLGGDGAEAQDFDMTMVPLREIPMMAASGVGVSKAGNLVVKEWEGVKGVAGVERRVGGGAGEGRVWVDEKVLRETVGREEEGGVLCSAGVVLLREVEGRK
ncbi:hypothetical protein BJ508DRAFT_410440 [Ascobolus immersus RN42]|uniref:Uncharacterized protein n=1 Tax=Ascobolus immersus RN42 TaxID=1160509 RepID=A0A3N4IP55_ASCIM|nr:hypothetical protein BJ508DRAFT_410440 [Ascobolus immersus RN42]